MTNCHVKYFKEKTHMGATSVTGVGQGSCEGHDKGRKEFTVDVTRLIGPRVVACQSVALDSSGDRTVVLPLLPGAVTDYVVVATDTNVSAAAAVGASLTFNTNDTTITLKGTASHTIQWVIVKRGRFI